MRTSKKSGNGPGGYAMTPVCFFLGNRVVQVPVDTPIQCSQSCQDNLASGQCRAPYRAPSLGRGGRSDRPTTWAGDLSANVPSVPIRTGPIRPQDPAGARTACRKSTGLRHRCRHGMGVLRTATDRAITKSSKALTLTFVECGFQWSGRRGIG